jgi:N-acetylglucosamine-1-phosphate uridyltransferase (contains nucleotidyltransferase and I-patch acetyltransferase domains)
MDKLKIENLLDLNETIAKEFLGKYIFPYEALPEIKNYILELIKLLDPNIYEIRGEIAIAKSAKVSDKCEIIGSCIIGENTEVKPFAYIRENVIVGNNCVVGNSSELKNSILFNHSKAPHYTCIGDSILGYKAHLGAGAKISNLKSDESNITIIYNKERVETNLRKMGAILGDNVEVGCNAVLNPGTIVGRKTNIYPLSNVRGFIGENKIFKDENNIIDKM